MCLIVSKHKYFKLNSHVTLATISVQNLDGPLVLTIKVTAESRFQASYNLYSKNTSQSDFHIFGSHTPAPNISKLRYVTLLSLPPRNMKNRRGA